MRLGDKATLSVICLPTDFWCGGVYSVFLGRVCLDHEDAKNRIIHSLTANILPLLQFAMSILESLQLPSTTSRRTRVARASTSCQEQRDPTASRTSSVKPPPDLASRDYPNRQVESIQGPVPAPPSCRKMKLKLGSWACESPRESPVHMRMSWT